MGYNETPMKGSNMSTKTSDTNLTVVETEETINTQKPTRLAKLKCIATNPMFVVAAAGITFSVLVAVLASKKPMEVPENTEDV